MPCADRARVASGPHGAGASDLLAVYGRSCGFARRSGVGHAGDVRVGQPGDRRGARHVRDRRAAGGRPRRAPGTDGGGLVGRALFRRAAAAAARVEVAPHQVHGAAGAARARRDGQAARRRDAGDRQHDPAPGLGGEARRVGAAAAAGQVGHRDAQPGRLGGVPAARRDRRDRAVELPRFHPDGLDRLRARRGERGRVQAFGTHDWRRAVAGAVVYRGALRGVR